MPADFQSSAKSLQPQLTRARTSKEGSRYQNTQNKRDDNKCYHLFYGGLKEALLGLSIKEFLNEIKDIDFNLINYQIDQFYV